MAEYEEIKNIISYLYELSSTLDGFKNETYRLLDEIRNLTREELLNFRDFYRGKTKVRELRYFIVDKILNNEDLDFEIIERKKKEINSKYPTDVFKSWTNFHILFELYYKRYRSEVKSKLNKLHKFFRDYLRKDFPDGFNPRKTIMAFDWNANFGSTVCWIVLMPKYFKDHNTCVRLTFLIDFKSEKEILYGLTYGEALNMAEKNQEKFFSHPSQVDVAKILEFYKEILPEFKESNIAIQEAKTEEKEKELEKLTKNIDFTSLENKFEQFPLYFDNIKDIKNQVLSCLKSNKNIIFYGPPGTGKTKLAELICQEVFKSNERNENIHGFKFTTATSDWTTFETIGGYMPKKGEEEEILEFQPGLFLRCFRDRQNDDNPINKWLIIDEINRADIDKAFGQLFTVLSGFKVDLPYQSDDGREISIVPTRIEDFIEESKKWEKNEYYVTNMWRLLATMNTFDKASLYEMSYAFMRRFAFIFIDVPKIKENIINEIIDQANWSIDRENIKSYIPKLEKIWEIINLECRKIGPATIYDILQYLEKFPKVENALTYSIIQFILPQFEGLDPEKLIKGFKLIKQKNPQVNLEILNEVLLEMFGVAIL